MQKILFITPVLPSLNSGGELAVRQSILSLHDSFIIDYVGPKISQGEDLKLNLVYYLESNSTKFKKIIRLLHGEYMPFYDTWQKIKKKIPINSYDYVYMESPYLSFIVKDVKKNNIPIIVRMHNIEADYFKNLYLVEKTFRTFLAYKHMQIAERRSLSYADMIIFLTQNDKKRCEQLYKIPNKFSILPICVDNKNFDEKDIKQRKIKTILMTGSLWYKPNLDAIDFILDKVWSYFENYDIHLVIGGSRPCGELEEKVKKFLNVTLIANPKDISTLFVQADIYLAPIFYGTGMKVKVAEAKSYGLPVVGDKHAFIGYEQSKGNFYADSVEQYIFFICNFLKFDTKEFYGLRQEVFRSYQDNFTQHISAKKMQEIFKVID